MHEKVLHVFHLHIILNSAVHGSVVRAVSFTVVNCCTNTHKTHWSSSSISKDKSTLSNFKKEDVRANQLSTHSVLMGLLDVAKPC